MDIRGGNRRIVIDEVVGANLPEHEMSFLPAEIALNDVGRIYGEGSLGLLKVGIPIGVADRFRVHAIVHPIEREIHFTLAEVEAYEGIGWTV